MAKPSMLRSSFCHLPGIGPGTEAKMWEEGVKCWSDVAESALGSKKKRFLVRNLQTSRLHLDGDDPQYFYQRLAANQHWRLFGDFRDSTAYLDIETTGLGRPGDIITTIALYDGKRIRHYVNGKNLDAFEEDIEKYKLIVTYNGKTFDIPFIERFFRIRIRHAHIDLRYVLASLGYRGGLKGCEKQLGFDRGELEGIDGFFAVLLWYDYANNYNQKALQTLLAYNIQDVITLEQLMVIAYNEKLIRETPFYNRYCLTRPVEPEAPFKPDRKTIDAIRIQHGWN